MTKFHSTAYPLLWTILTTSCRAFHTVPVTKGLIVPPVSWDRLPLVAEQGSMSFLVPRSRFGSIRPLSSSSEADSVELDKAFEPGAKVQVEVISFGPLGASVEVIGIGHEQDDLLPVDQEPYGTGLILQKEISYFREGRDNLDVVKGEILPAFIQNVREDGKMDVGLRPYGGKAKAKEVGDQIMERLEQSADGTIPVGDKSTPDEIKAIFPGVSKSAFKKALGALYRQGSVKPEPTSISLLKE